MTQHFYIEDLSNRTPQVKLETIVILFSTVLCLAGNSLVMISLFRSTAFAQFNRCHLLSVTIADLFVGLFVTQVGVVCSLYNGWVFNSTTFCCVEAHILAFFLMVSC